MQTVSKPDTIWCPCPNCGEPMPECLALCVDCQWKEAEAAHRQESIDLAAECERYADDLDWHRHEASRAATRDDDFEWGEVEARYDDWREADRLDLEATRESVLSSLRGF